MGALIVLPPRKASFVEVAQNRSDPHGPPQPLSLRDFTGIKVNWNAALEADY